MPLTMVPMLSQAFIMLGVSVNRIRDFLILPQLKGMGEKSDDNETEQTKLPTDVVIGVRNGKFKWGPPPEIPLSRAEKQKIEAEQKKREKEAKEKTKEKISKNKSQSAFAAVDSSKKISKSTTEIPDSITTVSVKEPVVDENVNEDTNPTSVSNVVSVAVPSITPSLSPFPSVSPSSDKNRPTLNNINLEIKKGGLTMIIGFSSSFLYDIFISLGGVGSGKSSLGSCLIGDIEKQEGTVKTNGSVAYCPQVAWINNNTVRFFGFY
jgi:ABC-type multidrug transport system ATPase subunit